MKKQKRKVTQDIHFKFKKEITFEGKFFILIEGIL